MSKEKHTKHTIVFCVSIRDIIIYMGQLSLPPLSMPYVTVWICLKKNVNLFKNLFLRMFNKLIVASLHQHLAMKLLTYVDFVNNSLTVMFVKWPHFVMHQTAQLSFSVIDCCLVGHTLSMHIAKFHQGMYGHDRAQRRLTCLVKTTRFNQWLHDGNISDIGRRSLMGIEIRLITTEWKEDVQLT